MSAKKIHENFANLISLFQLDKVNIPLVEEAILHYFDVFFAEHEENKLLG